MGKGAVGEKRGEGVKIVAISGATGGIGRDWRVPMQSPA